MKSNRDVFLHMRYVTRCDVVYVVMIAPLPLTLVTVYCHAYSDVSCARSLMSSGDTTHQSRNNNRQQGVASLKKPHLISVQTYVLQPFTVRGSWKVPRRWNRFWTYKSISLKEQNVIFSFTFYLRLSVKTMVYQKRPKPWHCVWRFYSLALKIRISLKSI